MIKKIYFKLIKLINKIKNIIKERIPITINLFLIVPKIIKNLESKGIKNVEKFKIKSWHLNYMYFIGELNGEKVFIKYNKNSSWIEHEVSMLEYIGAKSKLLSTKTPKLYFYQINSKYNYLVEEFFEYKSIRTMIKEGLIKNKENVYQEFIEIIIEMQKIGLLHLDINADNVYLSEKEKVYIIDFGFSMIKNNIDFNFINDKHLKSLILLNLNTENRLEVGYIDDAFSFLEIAKKMDFELITKNYDYWEKLNDLTNKLYFNYMELNDEIK